MGGKKKTITAGRMACGRLRRRQTAAVLAVMLAFLPGIFVLPVLVQGAAGTVYTCTINRCYAHPVTGEIEDSGGEASYATGQGMVEGAVASQGILEVTDDGSYYLTFRISLVDFTSDHSFSVQSTGESGWSAATPAVTANGSDSNGTTSDLCIQVPGENCVVRGSMYVTPMGRDVVFYFYPDNYMEGNTTDMTASMVTESSGGGTDSSQAAEAAGQPEEETAREMPAGENGQSDSQSETAGSSQAGTGDSGKTGTGEAEAKAAGTDGRLSNTISQDAAPEAASDEELNSAQGLSLSTASGLEADDEDRRGGSGTGVSLAGLMAAITVAMTLSGLILMAAAAVIVYYFRKNWRRWGGYDQEGYEEDDG